MKPLAFTDLDLSRVREHVKLMHPGKRHLLPAVDLDKDVGRLHAQWHVHPGEGHQHGGGMVSVEYGPGRFSVHPLGWFTGGDSKLEGR